MKVFTTLTLLTVLLLAVPSVMAQETDEPGFQDPDVEKSAQTGFKFLSLSLDARAAAMGGAFTAIDVSNSVAMFYNPANMAYMESAIDLAVMRTEFIADITYSAGGIAYSPRDGLYGVFGVSVAAVSYGEIEETVYDAANTYRDLGTFEPTALVVGVGYARALSDRFAIGGNLKYARQDMGTFAVGQAEGGGFTTQDYNKGTAAFDFGVLYKTGFRSLNFAMSVRNFSPELRYEQESFELPLTFRIGVAMDVIDLTSMDPNMHAFRLAVDAERPRDFAEHITIGGEYVFMNTLALRAGRSFPTNTERFSVGAGLQQDLSGFGFAVNYAFSSYEVFDAVHRLGVQLSL